ncbi:MAG: class D beta-lactamase [Sphingomonadales bacterium]|nr:class D beta-lactamase [Sphingomonadales bacterium]
MRLVTILLLAATFLFGSCTFNNVKEDERVAAIFSAYNVQGCFGLMDNGTTGFTIHNLSRFRDSAYLPASTFKIVNSLIGLQTGKISSDSMIIPWDGVVRSVPEWNQDLSMYRAFRASSVPYYQEVARRIGKDTMQFWVDSMGYGAMNDTAKVVLTSAVDTFWLDNSIRITPDAQLGLVKRLYFNQLPFFRTYQEMVQRAMLIESNTLYRLAYKTGTGTAPNGNTINWVVGWVEENNHPYFFVLNTESTPGNPLLPERRKQLLTDILKGLGFFKGNM